MFIFFVFLELVLTHKLKTQLLVHAMGYTDIVSEISFCMQTLNRWWEKVQIMFDSGSIQ